jgi:2',3'-cyclic-nucleotide 2'-phosphodiesterase (5'-nucleotidase family)
MNRPYAAIPRAVLALLLGLLALPWAAAETASLLILHTNDIHDHVRAGDGGLGGLPYVAGYVRSVRAERDDVLVLDAGDVAEKGDFVAHRNHSKMTYELLRRIGYHGVTIGNHEHDEYLQEGLRRFEEALGQRLLCLNLLKPDGSAAFEPSRIVEVNGIRVGLTGAIVPRKPEEGGLDAEQTGVALARESRALRERGAQLVIAVCHVGVKECAIWSRAAPEIDVWVSGHSHEAIEPPRVVEETGAIIVQAGSYARWVGRLELEVDLGTGKVVSHSGRLVPMTHSEIEPDREMLTWVMERERELAPEAAEFVFHNPTLLDGLTLARLAADGLRASSGAEIGFCHAYQVIREVLPPGPVDYNALFLTGGQRGEQCVYLNLTGAEIAAYVNALHQIQGEPPEWTGFRVARDPSPDGLRRTDLEPARIYRVVMPRIEYETRLLRLAEKLRKDNRANPLAAREFKAEVAPVNYTDSLRDVIKRLAAAGESPRTHAARIAAKREL